MAWAHEQTRLRKPLHWTTQVRAIDSEDQKLLVEFLAAPQIAHVDASSCSHAIPGLRQRILVPWDDPQSRLVERKLAQRTQQHPIGLFPARHRGRQVAYAWNGDRRRGDQTSQRRQQLEKRPPRRFIV